MAAVDVPNPLNSAEASSDDESAQPERKLEQWEVLARQLDEPTRSCAHRFHKAFIKWSYFRLVVAQSPLVHKAFIATVSLQSLWLLITRIVVMVETVNVRGSLNTLQWWNLVIVFISMWFCQSFAMEAVVKANSWELVAFFVVSAFLILRDALSAFSSTEECQAGNLQVQCVGFLVVTCAFNFVYWVLAALMFTDLRWIKYKSIGTNSRLRALYMRWEFFNAIKKMDLQFSLVLLGTGFVFFNGNTLELTFLGINILLLLLEFGWSILGKMAIRQGSYAYALAFAALSWPNVAFIIAIAVLASDPTVDAFDAAKKDNAEGIVIGLLLVGALNRVVTVICMTSMAFMFHTKEYEGLKDFFRQKKTKFIPLGLRPPPVALCGCNHQRCRGTCGRRCADCFCDRVPDPTEVWRQQMADTTSERSGEGKSLELTSLPSGTASRDQGGAGQAKAAASPRDSFTAAYLAAKADRERDDLVALAPGASPATAHETRTVTAAAAAAAAAPSAPSEASTSTPHDARTPSSQSQLPATLSGLPKDQAATVDRRDVSASKRRERLAARRAKRLERQERQQLE